MIASKAIQKLIFSFLFAVFIEDVLIEIQAGLTVGNTSCTTITASDNCNLNKDGKLILLLNATVSGLLSVPEGRENADVHVVDDEGNYKLL